MTRGWSERTRPACSARARAPCRRRARLHRDEQKRLLTAMAKATGDEARSDRMLVELLLGTGIRIGSLALEVGDLDYEHGEIRLRRTKDDRPTISSCPRRWRSG
jgi:site-specific recombinase XerD